MHLKISYLNSFENKILLLLLICFVTRRYVITLSVFKDLVIAECGYKKNTNKPLRVVMR
jgi:hypothetical protein